jgi:hypothetical protein
MQQFQLQGIRPIHSLSSIHLYLKEIDLNNIPQEYRTYHSRNSQTASPSSDRRHCYRNRGKTSMHWMKQKHISVHMQTKHRSTLVDCRRDILEGWKT